MVQQMIRRQLWQDPDGKGLMQAAYHQAYKILRCATPAASKYQEPFLSLDQHPHIVKLLRHISHFGTIAAKYDIGPDHDLASLLYDAGFLVWRRQIDLEEGIHLFNQALKFLPKSGGVQEDLFRSHIYLVAGRTYAGMASQYQAKSAKLFNLARILRQRIYERLGPYDRSLSHKIWLFCARVDVAIDQLRQGAMEVAQGLFEECLNEYSTWCSQQEMPFDIAKVYYGLADCHLARGNLEIAAQCADGGRAAVERCLTSSLVHGDFFLHGSFLRQLGEQEEALTLHECVFQEQVKC